MALQIHETLAKSIIAPTKVPSADFAINPYTGCQFACMYCFASFMGRFVGETNNNWGNYVYVKTNAVELMEKDIYRLLKHDIPPRISISTVTDPYQGVERKYRLTRGILGVFIRHNYQGRIGILTKSPTVLDDLGLLKQLPGAEVGLSITTSDDRLSRQLDAMAPLAHARLDTARKLIDAGIKTYVFVGPFLPHMHLHPELIDQLFASIRETGVEEVKVEYLNLPSYVRPRLRKFLKDQPDDIQLVYAKSQTSHYRGILEPVIREALSRYGLRLRFNDIVHHISNQELEEAT